MRRTVGVLLLLHGLAHAGAGMWLATSAPVWIVSVLWWLAITGFLAAGTGLLGVSWLDRHWRSLSSAGALASLALIMMSWHPVLMIGAAIDGAILLDGIPFVHRSLTRFVGVPEHPAHRQLSGIGSVVAALLIAYVTSILIARPWYMRWSASDVELAMHLTGDPASTPTGYRVDHAVTIRAPADSVWPWLVQSRLHRSGLFVFEPAHFIMERGMLLGIEAGAENVR